MRNKVVNEFQNWGDEYLVEFDIAVANLPSSSTSVFRFTSTNGNGFSDGDRIPALFILKDGIFHFVTSASNDPILTAHGNQYLVQKKVQANLLL